MTPTALPMPEVRAPHRAGPMPSRWKLLPGTGLSPYECTPKGIASRCGGNCCKTGWWPPKPNGACVHLDAATGCTLGEARPVACHLYPLQVNANGTLVLHGMTRWPTRMCMGNRRAEGAPLLIDALRGGLVALFGEGPVDAARAALLEGREYWFDVPPWVLEAIEQEARWEAAGEPPLARTR